MTINPIKNNQVLYETNNYGDINVNSIKNEQIFNLAQSCDIDGNDYLENAEIANFIEQLKYSKDISDNINGINKVEQYTQYLEKFDSEKNILYRAFIKEGSNEQLMFTIVNDEPTKCFLTESNNVIHELNLDEKTSILTKPNDNKRIRYNITNFNVKKLKAIANGTPEKGNSSWIQKLIDYFEVEFR